MRYVSAVSKVSIPLEIRYTCEYCGAENIDTKQKLVTESKSLYSPFNAAPSEWQKQQASEGAINKMQELINSVQNNKEYDRAGLTCVCSSCGKSPVWARKVKPAKWAMGLFVVGVLFSCLMLYVLIMSTCSNDFHMNANGYVILVLAIAACIPQIMIWYNTAALRKELASLPNEKLPRIRVLMNRS